MNVARYSAFYSKADKAKFVNTHLFQVLFRDDGIAYLQDAKFYSIIIQKCYNNHVL